MNGRRATLALLVAALLLHFVATLPFPQPCTAQHWITSATRVSPDLLFLLAVVLIGGATNRSWWWSHGASLSLLLLTAFRAANVLVPLNFERPFELRDTKMAWGLWHLLMHDLSSGEQILWVACGVLGLAAVHVALAWSFARVALAARDPRRAFVIAGGLQAVVLSCALGGSFHGSAAFSLARETVRTILATDAPFLAQIDAGRERMNSAPRDLTRLQGADVHFVIVESYGRATQTRTELSRHFQSVYADLLPEVQAANFEVVSSVCRPAVYGGQSWLAHAQLWTAVFVDRPRGWELLLQSDCPALPKVFASAGYRTVEVAPAMDRHWPEGMAFYGFTDEVTQLELGYTGTRYHWGRMPDQFAMHHLLEKFVEPTVMPRTTPLFTSFVSVTNHLPFRRVPRYVDDWCIDADTFAGPPLIEHDTTVNSVTDPAAIVPAFRDTLEYSLRTTIGFVTRLKRPSLVVVIGDHQPPFCSFLTPPDRTLDVIIHVFSNRPDLLQPLREGGFVDGFEVPAATESFDTREFAPTFLRLYSK